MKRKTAREIEAERVIIRTRNRLRTQQQEAWVADINRAVCDALDEFHAQSRVLSFDTECRPLSYLGADFTTGEITAIAACWVDQPESMQVWLLGRDNPKVMLRAFRVLYDEADVVTGHYIRAHDLPILNGAMLEHGLPTLDAKMCQDTKIDLVRSRYLSKSQESIAGVLDIPADKKHMTQPEWREANRLTKKGLALTRERVIGDVVQHIGMRAEMLKRGLLRPPRVWRP